MKNFFGKIGRKLLIFVKEIGNLIGNLFVPVASLLVATATILQAPIGLIKALKKLEYWVFKVSGTLPAIEKAAEDFEKITDKYSKTETK